MRVSEIWRYPVKSLHGEQLPAAELTADGVRGDRILHVRSASGPRTGRTRAGVLTLHAATDADGQVRISGHPWDSPAAASLIRDAAGPDARLAAYSGPERFDVLPLLIATDAEVSRLHVDRRRLRPNLVISGTLPFQERSWPGHALKIGDDVVVGIDSVRLRCVVTTIDPDTGEQDLDVLRRIHRDFGSRTALNSWVVVGGTVRVDDEVTVVELSAAELEASHPGYHGWITGAPYALP